MRTQSQDTSAEAERVLIELLRAAPPWRKWQMIESSNRSVRQLAMAGLRLRHPNADEDELWRRMVDQSLGRELAEKVFRIQSGCAKS